MNKFQVAFKDNSDKQIVMLTMLAGILFGFLAFGVTAFCFSSNLSEQSKKIINAFLNFDLILFIVAIAIGFIPFINFLSILLSPVLWIVNLIIILKALKAINDNNNEIEIPVIFSIF